MYTLLWVVSEDMERDVVLMSATEAQASSCSGRKCKYWGFHVNTFQNHNENFRHLWY